MFFRLTAFLVLALAFRTTKAANATAFIDPELTYLLPPEYNGDLAQNFVDTNTSNKSENTILATARKAPFISYDPEFTAILGPNPTLKLVAQREAPFADEAGVWVSDRNEVWFTSSTVNNESYLMVLDLKTSEIYYSSDQHSDCEPEWRVPLQRHCLHHRTGYIYRSTMHLWH
jgi:gluconolactonase